jgi:hypothetical protein
MGRLLSAPLQFVSERYECIEHNLDTRVVFVQPAFVNRR